MVDYDNSIYGIEKKQFPCMLCITNMLLHGIDVPKIYHDNSLLKDVLDYTVDDQFDVIHIKKKDIVLQKKAKLFHMYMQKTFNWIASREQREESPSVPPPFIT